MKLEIERERVLEAMRECPTFKGIAEKLWPELRTRKQAGAVYKSRSIGGYRILAKTNYGGIWNYSMIDIASGQSTDWSSSIDGLSWDLFDFAYDSPEEYFRKKFAGEL